MHVAVVMFLSCFPCGYLSLGRKSRAAPFKDSFVYELKWTSWVLNIYGVGGAVVGFRTVFEVERMLMNHWVFCPLDHIPTLLLPKATDPRRNSHHRSRQYCADMFSLSADLNYCRWHWHGLRVAAKIVCLDPDRTQVSNYRDVYSSDRSFQCFQNSHSVVQSVSCFTLYVNIL